MYSKHNGFTLIELMVITAIFGILSTIALTSYSSYTNRAYIKACHSEASAMAKIVVAAVNSNNPALLPSIQISSCSSTSYNPTVMPTANFTFTAKNSGTAAIITCDYQTGSCTSDQ